MSPPQPELRRNSRFLPTRYRLRASRSGMQPAQEHLRRSPDHLADRQYRGHATTHLISRSSTPAISRRNSAISVLVAVFDKPTPRACLTAAVSASACASVNPAAVRLLTVSGVSSALIIAEASRAVGRQARGDYLSSHTSSIRNPLYMLLTIGVYPFTQGCQHVPDRL